MKYKKLFDNLIKCVFDFDSITSGLIFKVSLTINLFSVIYNIISDCDETYNYWEPLHYLIYKRGFQTWEYSPQFGLRSYLYLYLCGWPAVLAQYLIPTINGRILFYLIRIYFSLLSSIGVTLLYRSLCRNVANKSIAVYSVFILILSAGSFICTTAFLPSSTGFICTIYLLSFWLDCNYLAAIAAAGFTALLAWPFSVAIGVFIAFDIVFIQRKLLTFVKFTLMWALIYIGCSVGLDSYFYGKLVFPSLNIVLYNVFNSHGSELYGVESFLFYLKNYILNFNIALFLVILYPFLLGVDYCLSKRPLLLSNYRVECIVFSMLALWNLVFFLQPHKEERFLFPCYPVFAIICGFSLVHIEKIFGKLGRLVGLFKLTFIIVYIILNLSRIIAVSLSYGAQIAVFSRLNSLDMPDGTVVCLGREWHRFPSHFFIQNSVNIEFVKSDFGGQLPAKFASSHVLDGTRKLHAHFNDVNKEEWSRYVNVTACDYIIDRDDFDKSSVYEKNWEEMNTDIRKMMIGRVLNPRGISGPMSLLRSFYVPRLYEKWNKFVNFAVYKNTA